MMNDEIGSDRVSVAMKVLCCGYITNLWLDWAHRLNLSERIRTFVAYSNHRKSGTGYIIYDS